MPLSKNGANMTEHAELTEKNRKIMADLIQVLFVEKNVDKLVDFISAEQYIQHNPTLPDGRDAAMHFLREAFANENQAGLVGAIKRVVVDGDIGVVHAYFRPKDGGPGGMVLVDIFRFQDGKVVEHWDVIQPWPLESVNEHPMI